MNEPFIPIEVDLTYKFESKTYGNTPIDVDLTYPTDNVLKIDEKLSVTDRVINSLNEWADTHNISQMYRPRNLRENGGMSLVPVKGGVDKFLSTFMGES